MDDMLGSTIERARSCLTKQGLDPAATIIQEIRSHMSEDRLRQAIKEDREEFWMNIGVFAAALEQSYFEGTGRRFTEMSDEEVGRFHRMIAAALVDLVGEIDPKRRRMIAAAVTGATWGNVDEQLRAAAWRAIRNLQPEAISVLRDLCDDKKKSQYTLFATFKNRIQAGPEKRSWLAMLEGVGCVHTAPQHDNRRVSTGSSVSSASFEILSVPEVTDIGRAVLETLKEYDT